MTTETRHGRIADKNTHLQIVCDRGWKASVQQAADDRGLTLTALVIRAVSRESGVDYPQP